ncbi:hypothetical protein [Ammoniphilus resinae]|uniref:Uncharacterized protein n=1 Tax=Ammoniphilus resinae TaxID=861532 RepID=A0ABS4GXL9_9BACL|nr:hypothetical protein [Ammoniphilus resinae]MBP1935012.1 hypothetical protein [Ammoniphilus resinae]
MSSYGHGTNQEHLPWNPEPVNFEKEYNLLKQEVELLKKAYLKEEYVEGITSNGNMDANQFYKEAYEEDRRYIMDLEYKNRLKDSYVWLDIIQHELEEDYAMDNKILAVVFAKSLIREKITGIAE